jgi:hypothetical protein
MGLGLDSNYDFYNLVLYDSTFSPINVYPVYYEYIGL